MSNAAAGGGGGIIRWVGIVNVTPDSFSDGGKWCGAEAAARRAAELVAAGAEGIDIGAESTRPGFAPVPWREEVRRLKGVVGAVKAAVGSAAWVSVDTRKGAVAKAAAEAGADCINDVGGGLAPGMRGFLRGWKGRYVLMHGMGHALAPDDPHPVETVRRWLERGLRRIEALGVPGENIAIDPGIGFGTTRDQDLALLQGLAAFRALNHPLWLGLSRKRIVKRLQLPGESLDAASWRLALSACSAAGRCSPPILLRMHEPRPALLPKTPGGEGLP